MASPQGPLTMEHLGQIQNGLSIVTALERQISLAKQAGLDVTAYEQQLADTKKKLLQVKQVYFPGM
jgi:hypothetical protein